MNARETKTNLCEASPVNKYTAIQRKQSSKRSSTEKKVKGFFFLEI